MKTGIIYKATNTINGKIYIGQTVVSLNERKGDHLRKATRHNSKSHFHNSIRKNGIDIFRWEIIENNLPREALNEREKYWISFYNSTDINIGYNLTHGGDAFEFTDEAKIKIGKAGKGRKMTQEQIKNMSKRFTGLKNPFYGKRHSEESKAKCGIKNIGRKLTKEHIAKCVHVGEDNGRSKITIDMAIEIKNAIRNNEKNCDIQRRLGVSKNILQSIKRGDTWRHVN